MEHRTWNIRPYLKIIHAFYLFYIKFSIPAILIALIIALSYLILTGIFSPHLVGYTYFLLAAGFQFVLYDLNHPGQYYFYYNLGISKRGLWISSITVNSAISTILFTI